MPILHMTKRPASPADAPVFDRPMDRVYRNYLETCAMLGIEPVPARRALN